MESEYFAGLIGSALVALLALVFGGIIVVGAIKGLLS